MSRVQEVAIQGVNRDMDGAVAQYNSNLRLPSILDADLARVASASPPAAPPHGQSGGTATTHEAAMPTNTTTTKAIGPVAKLPPVLAPHMQHVNRSAGTRESMLGSRQSIAKLMRSHSIESSTYAKMQRTLLFRGLRIKAGIDYGTVISDQHVTTGRAT